MTVAAKNMQHEFDAIRNYLTAAQEIVKQGHMPDMVGLDKRIADLCMVLEKSAPELQQQFLPRLDELLKQLDICEAELRAFHESNLKKEQPQ